MKFYYSILLLLFVAIAGGCNDHETVTPPLDYPADLDCDFGIGNFDLLPSSLSYSPYNGKSNVFFIDSIGNLIKMKISSYGPTHFTGAMIKYDVVYMGDTVRYCYHSEELRFTLANDSIDIKLSPTITAKPSYQQPEEGIQYDYFEVWLTHPKVNPYTSTQVFRALIDIRTAPANNFENIHLPSYDIFGRNFSDVEYTDFTHPAAKLFFNQSEGIVSFTDGTGKTWRFERFE